ncbi:MAG: MFS transporter [Acidimicrobiales bacterium]
MRLGVDPAPLRASAAFRRLYLAGFVSMLGDQATYVTAPFQLRELTHSTLAVGALGLVELAPLVVFGLWGGALADRVDRRRLVVWCEVVVGLATVALFLNALAVRPTVVVLYVFAGLVAAAQSLQAPSLAALDQVLVPHDLQRAAATLATLSGTVASILGPALGGLAAVVFGPRAVYGATLVTVAATFTLLASVRLAPALRRGTGKDAGDLAALREAARYARTRPDVTGTYLVDLLAMVLAYPVTMVPFVAARFDARYALTLLYVGLPLGALLATLTSRWTHRVHHYGRAVVASAALWGLGVALFGVAGSLPLALVGLVVGGAGDAVSGIFRQTLWNESIAPEVRGRMAGLEMISYSLGPTAGQFRAGAMAAWVGLRASLAVGGVACSASVVAVSGALPALWRFDARTDPHVARVRARRAGEGSEPVL